MPWQRLSDQYLQHSKVAAVLAHGAYGDSCSSLPRHFRPQAFEASNILLLDLLVMADSYPYSPPRNGRKTLTHFPEQCSRVLKYLQMTDGSWFSAKRSNRSPGTEPLNKVVALSSKLKRQNYKQKLGFAAREQSQQAPHTIFTKKVNISCQ